MIASLLFVPGDSERKIAKAASGEAPTDRPDVIIFDLEDAVAPNAKATARVVTAGALGEKRASGVHYYVRVNSLDTGLTADDLAAVMPAMPDGIMLPKCNGPDDVHALSGMLAELEPAERRGHTQIMAIVTETPRGVLSLMAGGWAQPRLAGMMWGAEDLAAELGAMQNYVDGAYTEPFRLARHLCLLAAREAGVMPIDTVYADFRDSEGLSRHAAAARRDGFEAKAAIHPAQLGPINAAFTPGLDEIDWAEKVVAVFADADTGVAALDGKMLDMPHLRMAQRILARRDLSVS